MPEAGSERWPRDQAWTHQLSLEGGSLTFGSTRPSDTNFGPRRGRDRERVVRRSVDHSESKHIAVHLGLEGRVRDRQHRPDVANLGDEQAQLIGCRCLLPGVGGVEFVALNTDAQALAKSDAAVRLRIGRRLTGGLGAGSDPEVGRHAAKEDRGELEELCRDADVVVVLTAGEGGGTGTGAAPVLAAVARALGALTLAVVTRPFGFERGRRATQAEAGVQRLQACVDTLVVVANPPLGARRSGDVPDGRLRAGRRGTLPGSSRLAVYGVLDWQACPPHTSGITPVVRKVVIWVSSEALPRPSPWGSAP